MADTLFGDGKDDAALRTIGEVAEALGLRQHVLRYWEQQFPQLQPLKRSGGRRYYRPADVALVREIDRLVNSEGYTLRGAKAALVRWQPDGGLSAKPLAQAAETADPRPAEQPAAPAISAELVSRLQAVRQQLAEALRT